MTPAGERTLEGKPEIPTRDTGPCMGDAAAPVEIVARGYDFEYRSCVNRFEIRRHADGGPWYVFPQPAPEAVDVIYPPDYGPFQFEQLRGPSRWARDLVQRMKAMRILRSAGGRGKILDVGTGSGMLLRQLRQIGVPAEDLYANDFSEHSLRALANEGFSILPGPAEHIETDERFQVICLNQVLEHMSQPVDVVRRLAGLLRPGGALFIETPSTDGIDCRLFRKRYWGGFHFPRHFHLFNEQTLRQLLADAGLDVREVTYLASPAFWIQCFHHRLYDAGWFRVARLFTIKNPMLLAAATIVDRCTVLAGGRTSNIRIVGTKPSETP